MTQWSEQQTSIFGWFRANSQRDRGVLLPLFPLGRHLVVRARAGTGKTTTLIEAIKSIEVGAGAEPPAVLLCAFNKGIKLELQRKVGAGAECLTLHALGYKFLRGAWGDGLTVDGDVEDERIEKARALLSPGDGGIPWEVTLGIKKLISIAKGVAPLSSVSTLAELCIAFACDTDNDAYSPHWMADVAHRAMAAALTPDPMGRITFDDMLFVPVASGYGMALYDWVIVDEAQDMNCSQLMLAQQALKPGGHLVAVGDDRQAIYGFRGADSQALDRLKRELANVDELGLNTTYRCPKRVVAKAQEIVADYYPAPGAPEGFVAELAIEALVDHVKPGDVILSRVNAPLVPLCLQLIRRGIGARIEGRDIGKLLAARARKLKALTVEDFLAKLSRWANTASARIVARGKAVDARLQQIRDVEATLEALTEDAHSIEDIYARCARMFDDVATGERDKQRLVVLSSVHKAKGLEWGHVYLLEDTLFVFGQHPEEIEEQNIAYTAITRAKHSLTLVKGMHAAA